MFRMIYLLPVFPSAENVDIVGNFADLRVELG